MKKISVYILSTLTVAMLFTACKKDIVYEVNDVDVNQNTANKNSVKSTTEFVSIAYTDIFGSTISQNQLELLSLVYLSFGDKKLVEDVIIKNMLNAPGVQLPTMQQMHSDIDGFVVAAYKKFYNRNPNEYELWQMHKFIEDDPQVTPEIVYYAFLTSDEYRYY